MYGSQVDIICKNGNLVTCFINGSQVNITCMYVSQVDKTCICGSLVKKFFCFSQVAVTSCNTPLLFTRLYKDLSVLLLVGEIHHNLRHLSFPADRYIYQRQTY